MEQNFAENITLEINLLNEYKLSSEFLIKELEEFIDLCEESNISNIYEIKKAFLSNVNIRAMYRLKPKQEKLSYLIHEVSLQK